MSLRTRCVTAALLFMAALAPATAQQAAPSAASTAAPPDAYACPVQVIDIVPLNGGKVATSFPAGEYAFGIQAFQRTSASIAGTLAVFAGDTRYDVPFKDAVAAGSTALTFPDIVPVVVKFPKPVKVNAAYVSALDGPNSGPCESDGVGFLAKPGGHEPTATVDVTAILVKRSDSAAQVAAPTPIRLAAAPCAAPFVDATMDRPASADTPELAKRQDHSGTVGVEVVLTRSGKLATEWVWQSSGFPELDNAALTAAKGSTFLPSELRCSPSAGAYFFVVVFARS